MKTEAVRELFLQWLEEREISEAALTKAMKQACGEYRCKIAAQRENDEARKDTKIMAGIQCCSATLEWIVDFSNELLKKMKKAESAPCREMNLSVSGLKNKLPQVEVTLKNIMGDLQLILETTKEKETWI